MRGCPRRDARRPGVPAGRRRGARWRGGLLALWVAGCLSGGAVACPADATASIPEAAQQARAALERLLALPGELPLSPDNRRQAEALAQRQLALADTQWVRWLDEERTAEGAKASAPLESFALTERVLNEVALAEADAAPQPGDTDWAQALQHPGLCRFVDQVGPLARVAELIEALPPAQRAQAWTDEAGRLSRWGRIDRDLTPTPTGLEDTLAEALPSLLHREPTPADAMWPAVSQALYRGPAEAFALFDQTGATRCAVLQWWALEQVRRGAMTPLQAVQAWRSAQAVQSLDVFMRDQSRSAPKSPGGEGYPVPARQLMVTGQVVVTVATDASGRAVAARVTGRHLQVFGIRGVPPVAFAHELDTASRDRALATPPPDGTARGAGQHRIDIQWQLK